MAFACLNHKKARQGRAGEFASLLTAEGGQRLAVSAHAHPLRVATSLRPVRSSPASRSVAVRITVAVATHDLARIVDILSGGVCPFHGRNQRAYIDL